MASMNIMGISLETCSLVPLTTSWTYPTAWEVKSRNKDETDGTRRMYRAWGHQLGMTDKSITKPVSERDLTSNLLDWRLCVFTSVYVWQMLLEVASLLFTVGCVWELCPYKPTGKHKDERRAFHQALRGQEVFCLAAACLHKVIKGLVKKNQEEIFLWRV